MNAETSKKYVWSPRSIPSIQNEASALAGTRAQKKNSLLLPPTGIEPVTLCLLGTRSTAELKGRLVDNERFLHGLPHRPATGATVTRGNSADESIQSPTRPAINYSSS